MTNFKKGLFTFLVALAGGFIALVVYTKYFNEPRTYMVQQNQAMRYASLPTSDTSQLPDLTYAAENSVHAVVHIMVTQKGRYNSQNPMLEWFFGDRGGYQQEVPVRQGFGSGVILADDGIIVTNNHVVDDADNIKVVLNDKREFDAKLIGTDPQTDIAVLKIDAKNLPFLRFGNSDDLKLGQWVLAVGNPFNLTSTVTAGIVSAKGRNIGINQNISGIEAFIQTDAAVNPGNSGGALVNTRGELIGINTAIASQTGSYSGYSFAIPASIVKKVIGDIQEYGEVQRALLGVEIRDVSAELAKEKNLDKIEGVYIGRVQEGGASEKAGIRDNDIIISVDGIEVNSTAQLQEQVNKHRPGDKVQVVVKRGNKRQPFNVTLRNKHGDTEIVKSGDSDEIFGSKFVALSDREKEDLGIRYGIKITEIGSGIFKDTGIRKGFIITQVNKNAISEVNDLERVIKNSKGGILVEGMYPNGEMVDYVFRINQK
ncbi:MAG: Do family serine endopeptidase [Prolixibacteraceae bacterium]